MKHHVNRTVYHRLVAVIIFIIVVSAAVPYAVFSQATMRALEEDVTQQIFQNIDSVTAYLAQNNLPASDVAKMFSSDSLHLRVLDDSSEIPLSDAQRRALDSDRTIVFSAHADDYGAGVTNLVVARYGDDYITAQLNLKPIFRLTRRAGLLSLLLSLVIGIFVSMIVGHKILRPVRELNIATQKVAAGDFSLQIPNPHPFDEFGGLINSFNVMTRELSSVELLRSDFVSDISHEFKTPLTAIDGYAHLLADETDPDARREYVQVITEETRRLSTLSQNVLTLNKLEKGSIPAAKAPVRIDEQIRRALTLLGPKWEAKNLRLELGLDEVTIDGYEPLLSLVWANLLENAVKFSPAGGCITLTLAGAEGRVCFCVRDEGPGISADDRLHIFDKFYQADKSRGGDGNGLGLSIALRVVQMHGGDIAVENPQGGGTAFLVTL